MDHYFGVRLVAQFYYGDKSAQRRIHALIRKNKVVPHTKVDNWKSLELAAGYYFSMPQLLAFDFYMCARAAYKDKRYDGVLIKTLRRACAKIGDLPISGWDIRKFKVMMIKPAHVDGYLLALGTLFDAIGEFNVVKHRKLCYTGEEFIGRLKEIHQNKAVYKQVRNNRTFWNVKTVRERLACQPAIS